MSKFQHDVMLRVVKILNVLMNQQAANGSSIIRTFRIFTTRNITSC